MNTHARPLRLTPDDDARILRTFRHMVREGERHGAVKALSQRFGVSPAGIDHALKRAKEREAQAVTP